MRKIIIVVTVCIGILTVGCGSTTLKSTKSNETTVVEATENESEEMSDRDIINAIYNV